MCSQREGALRRGEAALEAEKKRAAVRLRDAQKALAAKTEECTRERREKEAWRRAATCCTAATAACGACGPTCAAAVSRETRALARPPS